MRVTVFLSFGLCGRFFLAFLLTVSWSCALHIHSYASHNEDKDRKILHLWGSFCRSYTLLVTFYTLEIQAWFFDGFQNLLSSVVSNSGFSLNNTLLKPLFWFPGWMQASLWNYIYIVAEIVYFQGFTSPYCCRLLNILPSLSVMYRLLPTVYICHVLLCCLVGQVFWSKDHRMDMHSRMWL